jgi:hypothetical protein
MILYVNGDSHTAAAEAVNPHAFAMDDGQLFFMGRAPHPENLAVSWGRHLSELLQASFHCEAESASSNTRILRTTRDWLANICNFGEVLMIIQWSTWEREEGLIDGTYYQVGASGQDDVPAGHQQRYKEYVVGVDWKEKTKQAHDEIWQLHLDLEVSGVDHIFFNGNNDFGTITDQRDWGTSYIAPYDAAGTYNAQIRAAGIQTVAPNSWHFGKDGHSFWTDSMLQYIIANNKV